MMTKQAELKQQAYASNLKSRALCMLILRHTTTDRDGHRTYHTNPGQCISCPHKALCGANVKG